MKKVGLVIIVIATILALYHANVRDLLKTKNLFNKGDDGRVNLSLGNEMFIDTGDLLLADIALQLLGLSLILYDKHEVVPVKRKSRTE